MIKFMKEVKIEKEFSVMPTDFINNYLADAYDERNGNNYYVVLCPENTNDEIRVPMKYFYPDKEYGEYTLMEEKLMLIKGLRKYIEYEHDGYFFDFFNHELFLDKHCGFIVQNPDGTLFHYISGNPVFNNITQTWEPETTSLVKNLGNYQIKTAAHNSKREVK